MPTVEHISFSSEQLLKSGGLPPSEGLSTLTTRQNSKIKSTCLYLHFAVFIQKLVCVRFNIHPTHQTCTSAAVKLNP